MAMTNCLNFGNPERPDRMWQFAGCIDGMREALNELELPVTGGNVSFYNETAGASVLPTPVIGMVGLLDKAESFIPNRIANAGVELFLMGAGPGRLDGSALIFDLGRLRAGMLEPSDYLEFRECERFLIMAASENALLACHDVSDGGLAVALTEMCDTGFSIDLAKFKPEAYDNDENNRLAALFAEAGHRWIIAVKPEKQSWVRTAAFHFSVPLVPLGMTADGIISVHEGGESWFEAGYEPLQACYAGGMTGAI